MNVFLGTDSRGSHGPGDETEKHVDENTKSWTNLFMKNHPDISFVARRSTAEVVSYSIYDSDPFMSSYDDKFFDIAFIQSGFNEGIEYWYESIYRKIVGNHFNPSALTKKQGDPDVKDVRCIYTDREVEKKMFELIRRKSKRCVFIGMHTLEKFKPHSGWNPTYQENAMEVNEVFSKLADEYLDMPQHDGWIKTHCGKDIIHFNGVGIQYILKKVESYL